MERRESWLGYLAIGLGVLALLVALHGQTAPQVSIQVPWAGAQQVPAAPAPPAAPPAPAEPARPEGPRAFRRELEQELRFRGPGPWHEHGWGHVHGPFAGGFGPGLFFWPFMFLGGLIKLGLALLAVMLGLRLLRGRRGPWSGWHRHPGGNEPHTHRPPEPPEAPTPPHTGPTAYL